MTEPTQKIVFLDRDGVINQDSEGYIKHPNEWRPMPGSLEAIAKLTQHGFRLFVITNQSGIARNYFNLATLEAIHQKMLAQISKVGGKIEKIYFCPHHPDDQCDCRKPQPGMLLQAAHEFNLDLSQAVFIGDSYRDVQAARVVAAQPMLVLTGYGQLTAKKHKHALDDTVVTENLALAAEYLIARDQAL